MAACPNCREENPERAKFCLACGSALAPAAPAAEERKLVTALFVDLVGFTSRSEKLDPEDVYAVQSPYHARLRRELERHGGTVEKFIGDAVFALFGAPVTHEDDPERAVRAALAVRESIADLNESNPRLDLHIRIGVNTGEALVALGARPVEGEGMASGDAINTANRLEANAPRDGILVGEATYRATRHAIQYRRAEPVQAKGKSEPVPAWEVVGLKEAATRPVSRAPLVGREAELAELTAAWKTTVRERRPVLATVVAPPGTGKTRLLDELARTVAADAVVYRGRCLAYGEGITYWPVVEIVKAAAGIAVSDGADRVSRKLGTLLEWLKTDDPEELRTIAAALANLIGAPTTPRGTYLAVGITQSELHWGLRRLFQLLAWERPLVLVFEDLHWAEPTLLELLAFVCDDDAPASILVLGSARPELEEAEPAILAPGPCRHTLRLRALDEAESEELLAALVGGDLPAAAQALIATAAGNPLFLEEIVAMLADADALDGEDVSVEALPVPESLQALIGSRLDRLPGDDKRVASNASVVGSVFWSGAVAHLDGVDEVWRHLDALCRRDLVLRHDRSTVAGEHEWAFKHVLVRDVAYARLPKRQRARLHARCAEWITVLPNGEDELIEIVAYHLEQACLVAREVGYLDEQPPVDEAVEALTRAAEKAERREGVREAERFYARALALLDVESPLGVELRLRQARMLAGLGQLGPAFDQLVEVEREAASWGLDAVRCGALLALTNIAWKQGRGADALVHLAEAEPLAVQSGDATLRVRAAFELSHVRAWFDGAVEAALAYLRHALELAQEVGDRALTVEGHLRTGMLHFNTGALAASDEQFTLCLERSATLGSRRDEARAAYALGHVKYYLGDLDEAERLARHAAELLDRTGDVFFQLQNYRALAKYALARGEPELAEDRIRQLLPRAVEVGGWLLIEFYRYLSEALVRQGRMAEAADAAALARESLPEEDPFASAAVLLTEVIAQGPVMPPATTHERIAEALQLLKDQEMLLDLEEARIDAARALRRVGDLAGAREQLHLAYEALKRIEARGLLVEVERDLLEADGAERVGPVLPS